MLTTFTLTQSTLACSNRATAHIPKVLCCGNLQTDKLKNSFSADCGLSPEGFISLITVTANSETVARCKALKWGGMGQPLPAAVWWFWKSAFPGSCSPVGFHCSGAAYFLNETTSANWTWSIFCGAGDWGGADGCAIPGMNYRLLV